MLAKELQEKGLKSELMNGIEYFDVQDIKDNHPDLKIDVKKILIVGKRLYITADNIQEITDFDKVMKSIFQTKN